MMKIKRTVFCTVAALCCAVFTGCTEKRELPEYDDLPTEQISQVNQKEPSTAADLQEDAPTEKDKKEENAEKPAVAFTEKPAQEEISYQPVEEESASVTPEFVKEERQKEHSEEHLNDLSEKDQNTENDRATSEKEGNSTPATFEPSDDPPKESAEEAYEREVVRLVNIERAKYGLPALTYSEELSVGAREKSRDMQENGYFSHTSPVYGSPFDHMKTRGISYRFAGENIAMGYRTPEEVVNAWMHSEGHRANILNERYTEIGVGYSEKGRYVTQWFKG